MAKNNSKGEGTKPYETKDGRWRAEIVVGWTAAGKPKKKIIYAPTRAECAAKLRAALTDQQDGILITGKIPTLIAWLDYYLDNVARFKVEARTLLNYQSYVRNHVAESSAARRRLTDLTAEDLEAIYATMRSKKLSETTVLQMHRIISRALKIAMRRGMVKFNAATRLDAPTAADFDPDIINTDDARKLIKTASALENGEGLRWMVAIALGPRQGERLALDWNDLDLKAGTLKIVNEIYRLPWNHGCAEEGQDPICGRAQFFCPDKHGGGLFIKKPKSTAGKRDMALPAQLVAEFKKHRKAQRKMAIEEGWTGPWVSANGISVDLVFRQRNGNPLNAQKDWTEWKAYLKDAGVPPVRVHDARHTAATTLLLMGVDGRIVMEMMGWSSAVMLKRYQHVMDVMKTDAANKVAGALWAPPEAPEPPAPDNVIDFASRRKQRQG